MGLGDDENDLSYIFPLIGGGIVACLTFFFFFICRLILFDNLF